MNRYLDYITLYAYAKINLSLYITGRTNDGYHLLDSVFIPIDLYDIITIKKKNNGINVICDKDIPTDAGNSAYKAAQFLMCEHTEIEGVEITIKKNIPSMAGLGGGSSDAAATLLGMNVLFNLGEHEDKLSSIASKIGADVPFFLSSGACRVQGIGEIIKPININYPLNFVLIKPKSSLSTPEVYKKHDEQNAFYQGNSSKLIEYLAGNDLVNISSHLHNDMQNSAISLCHKIQDEINFLLKNGALNAIMTGSGSCVFGIFKDKDEAQQAIDLYDGDGACYNICSIDKPICII